MASRQSVDLILPSRLSGIKKEYITRERAEEYNQFTLDAGVKWFHSFHFNSLPVLSGTGTPRGAEIQMAESGFCKKKTIIRERYPPFSSAPSPSTSLLIPVPRREALRFPFLKKRKKKKRTDKAGRFRSDR